jgi:uncharacterized protein (UPF0548 family)
VYLIDESGESLRYGFAYGTLNDHAEIGEERFTVEYHPRDGSIWYDIYALSKPGTIARLASPLARRIQKRFAIDSGAAMLRTMQGVSKARS